MRPYNLGMNSFLIHPHYIFHNPEDCVPTGWMLFLPDEIYCVPAAVCDMDIKKNTIRRDGVV